MKEIRIGPSEQAVLDWLKRKGRATAAQVGEAVYGPACGPYEYRRRVKSEWARKLLGKLYRKGLVHRQRLERAQDGATVIFRPKP